MNKFKHVIVGGGMVGGFLLRNMAKLGLPSGEVCLLSDDSVPPYERPPLSKEFLADEKPAEKVFVLKPGFVEDQGVVMRLQTRVTAIDPAAHVVHAGEEQIGYEKLVLATGSGVRRLDLPGAELDGVLYLRTFDDCVRLKEALAQAQRVLVIGGGFIGTEVSARLAGRGLETTVLFRDERLLSAFFPAEISAVYADRYEQQGVRLIAQANPVEFVGDGNLEGVKLDGGEVVPADVALVAVGVLPSVCLAEAAGLTIDRYLVVDEFMRTSDPDIYAAGDMVSYPDRYSDSQRHIEHEEFARVCGRHLAQMLLGEGQPLDYLPMVWSDVYDLSWEFRGTTNGADRVVYRGDPMSGQFSAWWLQGERLIGVLTPYSKDTSLVDAAVALIKERRAIDPATLEDPTKAL